jgi:hypothetical protein
MTGNVVLTSHTDEEVRAHLDPAVMEGLLTEIVHSELLAPPRGSRRKTWALAAGAVLGLGSTAAIAASGMTSEQRETGVFNCVLAGLPGGAAGGGIIGSVTGDPVADCQAEYQRVSDKPAPPMVAYSNSRGGLEVLPASTTPSAGYVPLPSGAKQDMEMILLDETFSDSVSGLATACLDESQAAARSKEILSTLGFRNWSVTVDRQQVVPDAHCWIAVARGRDKTVRVVLGGMKTDVEGDARLADLVRPLRASTTECWDRKTALAKIRAAAVTAGIPDSYLNLRTVDDPTTRCSVIHVTPGGAYFVVVRGPAS